MDLRKLLQKVETAQIGSLELDNEFVSTFRAAPPNVTRSIDAAVQLIETELPGWWWNCGHCAGRNGASLYVPGSSRIRTNFPGASLDPDCQSRPQDLRLLQHPRWGELFHNGFHCDRSGTVPLAILIVFLQAKIALTFVQQPESTNKIVRWENRKSRT